MMRRPRQHGNRNLALPTEWLLAEIRHGVAPASGHHGRRLVLLGATAPISLSFGHSLSFYRDVLERPGIGKAGDQPETGLADPRSNRIDKGDLPNR
jgi:hypothetical protein